MAKPQVHGEVARQVRQVVEPAVAAAGLYLESVHVKGAPTSQVVQVTVDLPETEVGSLGSDRLGDVSRAISAALDRDDVVPGAYTLEVSTPGATRALEDERQFRRARTRMVKLTLRDGGTATGRLADVVADENGETTLVLDMKGRTHRFKLANVAKGKVELEMNRVEAAEFANDDDGAEGAPGVSHSETLGKGGDVSDDYPADGDEA